jgi:hypothetical protein
MITPKHNQEKESKGNWGNYEKMKAKKIKSEKK